MMTSKYWFFVNYDDVEGRNVYPLKKVLCERYTDMSNGCEIEEDVWVGVCLEDLQPQNMQVLYYWDRHCNYKYIGHVDVDDRLIIPLGEKSYNRIPWYIVEAFNLKGSELLPQEYIRIDVWAEDMGELWRHPSKFMKRSTVKAFRERYIAKLNELTSDELKKLFANDYVFTPIGEAGKITGIKMQANQERTGE